MNNSKAMLEKALETADTLSAVSALIPKLTDAYFPVFDSGAVWQVVEAAVKNQDPEDPDSATISLNKAKDAVVGELCRAEWQKGRSARWLGIGTVGWVAALLGSAVAGAQWPNLWRVANIAGIPGTYWFFGALGGAAMGLYSYTHACIYKDLKPNFNWWALTKPLTGAVMGAVVYALLKVGAITISQSSASSSVGTLLYSVVAFAAGFKEQWFLQWLSELAPQSKKDSPGSNPGTTPTPKGNGSKVGGGGSGNTPPGAAIPPGSKGPAAELK
jgi:hypothetical protein